MARTPVSRRVAAILDAAPIAEGTGEPEGYTHLQLARRVYDVDTPTAAQLSAVRRVVAALVAAGRAEREEVRWFRGDGRHTRRYRGRDGHVYERACFNPAGVEIRRPAPRRPISDVNRERVLAQLAPRQVSLSAAAGLRRRGPGMGGRAGPVAHDDCKAVARSPLARCIASDEARKPKPDAAGSRFPRGDTRRVPRPRSRFERRASV
jgi:hypothetical protein